MLLVYIILKPIDSTYVFRFALIFNNAKRSHGLGVKILAILYIVLSNIKHVKMPENIFQPKYQTKSARGSHRGIYLLTDNASKLNLQIVILDQRLDEI